MIVSGAYRGWTGKGIAAAEYQKRGAVMAKPDKKKTEAKQDKKTEETKPFGERHHCLICGKPGPETICERCKLVVQAEALAGKRKVEKEGGGRL